MNIEHRLAALEDAHRALSARNEALLQICKVILPLAVASNPTIARRLLVSCYDITSEHMERLGWDTGMQKMTRDAMDEIARVLVLALTDTP